MSGRAQRAFRAAGITPGAEPQPAPPPFKLEPWQYNDPTLMEPRHWLLGTLLLRGEMTTLGSTGGTGKTAIAIACALACITGRKDIVGLRVFQPVKVAFLTLEDDRKELARRIAAAMDAHGVRREDVEGALFVYSARERPFLLAYVDESGEFQRADDADALAAEIVANEIGLVIIDPLIKSHHAIENSNDHMDKLASLIIDIATRTDAAILVPCHNRKGGETGRDAIRGGSALVDAARINRGAAGMTEASRRDLVWNPRTPRASSAFPT
jgi:RecA-family ATPase